MGCARPDQLRTGDLSEAIHFSRGKASALLKSVSFLIFAGENCVFRRFEDFEGFGREGAKGFSLYNVVTPGQNVLKNISV